MLAEDLFSATHKIHIKHATSGHILYLNGEKSYTVNVYTNKFLPWEKFVKYQINLFSNFVSAALIF